MPVVTGTSSQDQLVGSSSDDTISGLEGADYIQGLEGNDTIYGGDEDSTQPIGYFTGDLINGGEGNDLVYAGGGNDYVVGGMGADIIYGGDGSDFLAGYGGLAVIRQVPVSANFPLGLTFDFLGWAFQDDAQVDLINGGNGNDRVYAGIGDLADGGDGTDDLNVSFASRSSGLNISLEADWQSQLSFLASATFQNFEILAGLALTAHNDVFSGDALFIIGGYGSDTITLGSRVFGGGIREIATANHRIDVATNGILNGRLDDGVQDTVTGTSEVESFHFGLYDHINGGAGSTNDSASVTLFGLLSGVNLNLSLNADWQGALAAITQGSITNIARLQRLHLTQYDDVVVAPTAAASASSIELRGYEGNDNLTGTIYGDTLYGDEGDDVLSGGDGNDTLFGGLGADQLQGGDGTDTASYLSAAGAVTVSLAYGGGYRGEAAGDTLISIENLIGSLYNDELTGNSGANILNGYLGDDFLSGGAGADTLMGGDGTDTADYLGSDAGVSINLSTGAAAGGHAQGDVLTGIERIYGSLFDDSLTGDAGANRLSGDDGDDHLYGEAGDDELDGWHGADFLDGGAGADVLAGGDGNDDLHGRDGNDLVLAGADNDTVWGEEGDDVLYGEGGSDSLNGGIGLDRLYGGAGVDQLVGEAGDDILHGHEGDDRIYGGIGNDQAFGGAEKDEIYGDEGNDVLYGDAGNDILQGGADHDILYGGVGFDELFGGEGTDT
ncbi:calcium-binding protein, partial [Brevundimonas aveniformis]|uniref:calcium-binding protein n=1 Tax=Brevundimonas aveniformis TaxID=370977 RepID=UPI00249006EC